MAGLRSAGTLLRGPAGDNQSCDRQSRGKIAAMSLLARRRYPEVVEAFDWAALWTLMDGDRTHLNIAHECVDRWIDRGTAVRLQFADGRREEWSFADLAAWSSRFAHLLERQG